MPDIYIKSCRKERLKEAINSHGELTPAAVVDLAGKFGVSQRRVRQVAAEEIDLTSFRAYRRRMKKLGIDLEKKGGKSIFVGAKRIKKSKESLIKDRLRELVETDADIDLDALNHEFELKPESKWVATLLAQVEIEMLPEGEKKRLTLNQIDKILEQSQYLASASDQGQAWLNSHQAKRVRDYLSSKTVKQGQFIIAKLKLLIWVKKTFCSKIGGSLLRPLLEILDFRL